MTGNRAIENRRHEPRDRFSGVPVAWRRRGGALWHRGWMIPAAFLLATSPAMADRTIRMRSTGYCAGSCCCGPKAKGTTASGQKARVGLIAADWSVLPKGTRLSVPGYGKCEVADRGSAVQGRRIDLFFNSHQDALRWGVRWVTVTVRDGRTARAAGGRERPAREEDPG